MTHPQQLRDKRQLLVLNSLAASAVHKGRDGTEEVEYAALTPTSWHLKAPVLTHGVSSTMSTQGSQLFQSFLPFLCLLSPYPYSCLSVGC